MNKKIVLSLLSSQIIFTSLMSVLGIVNSPAQAAQRVFQFSDGRSCIRHPHGGTSIVCTRSQSKNNLVASRPKTDAEVISAQPSNGEVMMLEFTEEESNAAIALFSCDCPYCINSLRALRNQTPMVY